MLLREQSRVLAIGYEDKSAYCADEMHVRAGTEIALKCRTYVLNRWLRALRLASRGICHGYNAE